jgi:hypothetical protein
VAVYGGGSATFDFATPQRYFGLLWGSVDDYNSLTFFDIASRPIATLTGADVPGIVRGDQTAAGTAYVNVFTDTPFVRVVAGSGANAFEFDAVAYGAPAAVPLPAAGWLFLGGLGLLGAAASRRRAPGSSRGAQ